MGTNYYTTSRKRKEELKNEIIKLANTYDFNTIVQTIEEMPISTHIGKSSYGWKFLFEKHPELYDTTRESINKYLKDIDLEIYNEEDEKISVEEFWKIVDSHQNDRTIQDYITECKNNGENIPKYIQESELITGEGLRFSLYSDFH